MRPKSYDANIIKEFLEKNKIATMIELQTILGTNINMTVIRKLKELAYYSSYSHRGKYYTLDSIIEFDSHGLWSFKSALFSRYGTLQETAKTFVNNSEAGFSTRELEDLLYIEVKEALLTLYKNKHVHRKKVSGLYIYFSSDKKKQKKQILLREDYDLESILKPDGTQSKLLAHELKAAIILFVTMLDEKQRRIYAGLESLKLGYGGDKQIADLFEIDSHTVAKGRIELQTQEILEDSIRRKGGGRIPTEKKTPES